MNNLTFVVWLLLYPVMSNLASLIQFKQRGKCYSELTWLLSGLFMTIFYLYIASLLYVPK